VTDAFSLSDYDMNIRALRGKLRKEAIAIWRFHPSEAERSVSLVATYSRWSVGAESCRLSGNMAASYGNGIAERPCHAHQYAAWDMWARSRKSRNSI
jgi:hypothetical protein